MNPKEIATALRKSDLVQVLAWAQNWTRSASYDDICRLVADFPTAQRNQLKLLLSDVVTGYPQCIWGIPTLFHYIHAHDRCLTLPLPDYSPDPDVTGISWLSLDILRRKEPLRPTGENVSLMSGDMDCAVLLVTTHTPTPPDLKDEWWAELFELDDGARLRLSARMVLPFVEALEAGCALLSTARMGTLNVDTPRLFLTDDAWTWAQDAGIEWRHALKTGRE